MTAAHASPDHKPADLRPLTTLRFIAAAWVVLYTAWPHLDVGFTPAFVAKGYLGVEVFFILSGFILSHVYLQGVGAGQHRHGTFLWARMARVYPLHLVTLFGMIAIGLAGGLAGMDIDGSLTDWRALPANLSLTHAWGLAPTSAFNHPSWSISAEAFAYLTFPAFGWAAWKMRNRPWLATTLIAASALGLYAGFQAVAGFPLTEATFRWGALRIVPCFALGCALYLVHRHASAAPSPRTAAMLAIVGVAGVVGVTSVSGWDALAVLFGGLVILGLAGLTNARAGVLASPLGVYLGEISYAIYMVCAPVLLVATNLAARVTGADNKQFHVIVWLVIVAMVIGVAAATYHLVERPARQALRGLGDSILRQNRNASQRSISPERGLQHSETIV